MLKFTKMEGLGNDYIYINCMNKQAEGFMGLDEDKMKQMIVKLSDRHNGIGSDGVILIENSKLADFKMRIFNSDGSEAEMCGNGIRCVGKYVYDKGLTCYNEITIETLAGIKKLKLFCNDGVCNKVCVDMGEPFFKSEDLPTFLDEKITKDLRLEMGTEILRFTLVSMGNPHAVTFVENISEIPIEKYGPIVENDSIFPNRTNVEFIEIADKKHIKMRVWERGSGETLACGTGACAAVVAGGVNGYLDNEVTVELLGGILEIKWNKNNHVYMTGEANIVFEGEVEIEETEDIRNKDILNKI